MHENVIILNLKDNCKALQAENKRLREALEDLRSEIDEDNCHDPETCSEVGYGSECLVCIIDEALKNEKATNSTTDD